MPSKLPQILVRLPARELTMLKLAAKAYRAPSVNWFCREVFVCMLNPQRWPEFATRLNSGAIQQTLELGQSTLLQDSRRRKDPVRGTRNGGERRRSARRGKKARRG